jgi:hypothetical protein
VLAKYDLTLGGNTKGKPHFLKSTIFRDGRKGSAARAPAMSQLSGRGDPRMRLGPSAVMPTTRPWPVLAGRKTHTGWLWTYVRDDRPLPFPIGRSQIRGLSPDTCPRDASAHFQGEPQTGVQVSTLSRPFFKPLCGDFSAVV